MICLDNTDTLEAGASVGAVVDCTVHGLVGTTFTNLYSGQLSDTDPTVIYTAAAAISIVAVTMVNTHSAAVSVNLYLDPANGGNPRRMIPEDLSLGIGYSMHFDGQRCSVLDANGILMQGTGVSDTAYAASWDGVTNIAPSKNAVYDKMELKADSISPSLVTPALGTPASGTLTNCTGFPLVQQNLLSNSGFGVWSNSTLENVRALPDATSVATGTSIASTAHLLTAGMLVKDAAGTPLVFEVISITDVDTFVVDRTGWTDGQGYEVTPGCIGADALGPDGWAKAGGNTNLFRQHNDGGTLTKDGSFYSLKIVTAATSQWIKAFAGITTNAEHYQKFAGRPVTIGIWAKTDTASHLRIGLFDGSHTYSSYHTGGDTWEWLELTTTMSATPSEFTMYIWPATSGNTAYVSQPMLIFGSSIGEGNYSPKPNEIIWLEKGVTGAYDGSPVDDLAATTLYTKAESSGKIPTGTKALYIRVRAKDSGSAGTNCYVLLHVGGSYLTCRPYGLVNDANAVSFGWIQCDSDGNLEITIEATGSLTLDLLISYQGIQL